MNLIEYEYAVAAMEELEIEKSNTSQEADQIEDELALWLNTRFEKLIAINHKEHKQIQDLQAEFGNEIEGRIRVDTARAYMAGANYVGRVVGEENIFQSKTNSDHIDALARGTTLFFWRQLDLQIKAEEAKTAARATLTDEQFASLRRANPLLAWYGASTSAELVANDAVTSSLAYGTVDKAKELRNTKPKYYNQNWKVVFISRNDERTCLICAALDYRYTKVEWEFGSPFIIYPRINTHKRCRCRLAMKIDNNLYPMM